VYQSILLKFVFSIGRVVFEAEASGGGEVRQVVSPTLPFPLSLPSPFHSPKFSDKPVGGKVRSSEGGSSPAPPPYKYQATQHILKYNLEFLACCFHGTAAFGRILTVLLQRQILQKMWATLAEFVLNRFCVILVSNTSDVHYVADLDYSWPDAELVCYVVKCHSESSC